MKYFFYTVVAIFTFSLLSSNVQAQGAMALSDKNGRSVKGEIFPGSKKGTVKLKRNDNTFYDNIPISNFSAESQKKIVARLLAIEKSMLNAEITPDSRLEIGFQRQKRSRTNDYGDIDDKIIRIQPEITIKNNERDKTFKNVKGEVIITGKEAVRKNVWVILNRQKFSIDAILPDGEVSWEGKQFECRYDPDYAGFDYDGYVIILRDKAGKIAMIKGSNSGELGHRCQENRPAKKIHQRKMAYGDFLRITSEVARLRNVELRIPPSPTPIAALQ